MIHFEFYHKLLPGIRWSRIVRSLRNPTRRSADAELRQKLILKTTEELLRSDDCEAILRNVVHHLVPAFGGWCLINLAKPGGEMVRLSEARSMNREKNMALDEIRRRFPPDPQAQSGLAYVIRTGQPQILQGISEATYKKVSDDPDYLRLWNSLGIVSSIIVPIVVRGRIYGGLSINSLTAGHYYGQRDLIFIQELAGLLGLALERAELLGDVGRSNQRKDEFLALLSHELRTPLSAILGWSQLLNQKMKDPAFDASRALKAIERNALVQKKLVEDILDISLVTMGRMRIEKEAVDIRALIEAVVDSVLPQAGNRVVKISAAADENALLVEGDPLRLQQAFGNLLNNAIKFSEDGSSIGIKLVCGPETIKVSICDSGIGIAADFLPHVFEQFRQGDRSVQRSSSGMGLGLALVRHIVDLHDGRVEAFSEGPGQGATFTVFLQRLLPSPS